MAMTTNESQGLTNQLNGLNETGSTGRSTPNTSTGLTNKVKKAKVTKAPKAQDDTSYYFKGSGTSQPTVATVSTPSPSPDYHQDINNINLFDYMIWPVIIFLVILITLYQMLKSYAQKHPAHGGFAHKHKRMHPGVPEPRIFK